MKIQQIHKYLEYANSAYDCTLSAWPKYGGSLVGTFDEKGTSTQGFVVEDGLSLVVTFRGTKEPRDILTDCQFRKVSFKGWSGVEVHRGFLAAYNSISKSLRGLLVGRRDSEIIFVGHSLGGAIATIAALEIAWEYCMEVSCVTFGCPRVGNKGFVDAAEAEIGKIVRVAHVLDPVQFLPPYSVGYRHTAGLFHVGKSMAVRFFARMIPPRKLIDFHRLDGYVKEVEKLIPGVCDNGTGT